MNRIIVGGVDVPEPCRKMPMNGIKVYWPCPYVDGMVLVDRFLDTYKKDVLIFRRGLMHLSEENAREHAVALYGEE